MTPHPFRDPVVIPAQAGIQEGMARWRINGGCCGMARQGVVACGQARHAGMAAHKCHSVPQKQAPPRLRPPGCRLSPA